MAPRSPSRPPLLSTNWDQRYDCNTCQLEDMDLDDDIIEKTWTCKACGEPVLIHMEDDEGQFLVRRIPANQLARGDLIYLGNNLSRLIEVNDSSKAQIKNGDWYLALKGIGTRFVESNRYYNCSA
ncbi:hypothetical protein QEM11_003468 [Pseudomonas putida]|uniref:hypothetical protein n=2 Tax=Bacteria TaxID=2 RepID=UPI002A01A97B|nr:hypothetical protein [Pseudomonas putida]